MTLLLDTSGLFAALNVSQSQHAACAASLLAHPGPLVLSPFVVAELDYLVLREGGVDRELALLEEIGAGAYEVASISAADIAAAHQVAARYRDLGLGVTDATILVLAQRYGTRDVLTLDHRHFRAVIDHPGQPLRLLPSDA